MATTVQSRKARGRNLQQYIVRQLLQYYPTLTEDDIFSRSMGASGTDVYFSSLGASKIPFSIEAKNQESLGIWAALAQCETNAKKEGRVPLLIFKRNRSSTYCALTLDDLLKLITKES